MKVWLERNRVVIKRDEVRLKVISSKKLFMEQMFLALLPV